MTVISLISTPCRTVPFHFFRSLTMSLHGRENFEYENSPELFVTRAVAADHQIHNFPAIPKNEPNLTKIIQTASCVVLSHFGSAVGKLASRVSNFEFDSDFSIFVSSVQNLTGRHFSSNRPKFAARRASSVRDERDAVSAQKTISSRAHRVLAQSATKL